MVLALVSVLLFGFKVGFAVGGAIVVVVAGGEDVTFSVCLMVFMLFAGRKILLLRVLLWLFWVCL